MPELTPVFIHCVEPVCKIIYTITRSKGCTIRFPGGRKLNSAFCPGEFCEIFRKKKKPHPLEGDEKKIPPLSSDKKEK